VSVTRARVDLVVNGKHSRLDVEPRRLLADALRHDLGLTGTHLGCEHGVCGACTVLVQGEAVRSCLMLAVQADGCEVDTVEGAGDVADLHPVQQAFVDEHGLQCGFCTPGLIMATIELLRCDPDPTDDEIREHLSGNICRCTGYVHIVRAVRRAATELAARRGDDK
jgi:aerobic carbon-monoxide dehydrogenase small subunit